VSVPPLMVPDLVRQQQRDLAAQVQQDRRRAPAKRHRGVRRRAGARLWGWWQRKEPGPRVRETVPSGTTRWHSPARDHGHGRPDAVMPVPSNTSGTSAWTTIRAPGQAIGKTR